MLRQFLAFKGAFHGCMLPAWPLCVFHGMCRILTHPAWATWHTTWSTYPSGTPGRCCHRYAYCQWCAHHE